MRALLSGFFAHLVSVTRQFEFSEYLPGVNLKVNDINRNFTVNLRHALLRSLDFYHLT